jgi:hypothetical protein
MPSQARPWVDPVPNWALPGGDIQVDNVSQIGKTPLAGNARNPPLAPDTIGRELTSNMGSTVGVEGSRGHDKIKQSFKFLSIWDLDYVLDPTFFDEFPLSVQNVHDNKMVYFILEDVTQGSP